MRTHLVSAGKAGRTGGDLDPDAVARVTIALLAGIELQRAMDPELDVVACASVARTLLEGALAPADDAGRERPGKR